MPSLYQIWLEAHNKGILAQEWRLARDFLAWATANKYKAEYGYKGEFAPENLLVAIPKAKSGEKEIERFAAAMTSYVTGALDVETLSKMKVPELKELAEKMEIDLKGITRKDDIIAAIKETDNEESF